MKVYVIETTTICTCGEDVTTIVGTEGVYVSPVDAITSIQESAGELDLKAVYPSGMSVCAFQMDRGDEIIRWEVVEHDLQE